MCPWYYNYEGWIYIMIWNCLGMCSSETLFKHYCFLYFQERKRRRLDTAHKSSVIAWSCFKLMCTRVYKHVYKNIIKNKSHHVVIYYNHLIITSHLYIMCTLRVHLHTDIMHTNTSVRQKLIRTKNILTPSWVMSPLSMAFIYQKKLSYVLLNPAIIVQEALLHRCNSLRYMEHVLQQNLLHPGWHLYIHFQTRWAYCRNADMYKICIHSTMYL